MTEGIPKNILEKAAREEGIKNPADKYELASPEEIQKEVEREINRAEYRIEVLAGEKHPSSDQRLLEDIQNFALETSELFRQAFLECLKEDVSFVSSQMLEFLREQKFDLPQFMIFDKEKGGQWLREFEEFEDYQLDSQKGLMVFNLPRPLVRFWWKEKDHYYTDDKGDNISRTKSESITQTNIIMSGR